MSLKSKLLIFIGLFACIPLNGVDITVRIAKTKKSVVVDVTNTMTIADLKVILQDKTGIPVSKQHITAAKTAFSGYRNINDDTSSAYDLRKDIDIVVYTKQ